MRKGGGQGKEGAWTRKKEDKRTWNGHPFYSRKPQGDKPQSCSRVSGSRVGPTCVKRGGRGHAARMSSAKNARTGTGEISKWKSRPPAPEKRYSEELPCEFGATGGVKEKKKGD